MSQVAMSQVAMSQVAMSNAMEVSRRGVLQGTVALPAAATLASAALAEDAPGRPEFNPRTWSFSVAERDRRWAAVRAVMGRPQWGLDAIITAISDLPANTSRYLTQIGMRPGGGDGAEVVFPRDPAKTVSVQVSGARFRDFWKQHAAGWMADGKLTVSADGGPAALAKQLTALGLNQAGTRIGVAKLAGSRFDVDGLVGAAYLDKLKTALPGVTFVPIEAWGTEAGPIEEVARIKGPEEQDAIRRATAASEQGVAAMVAAIRAGARTQGDLWFAAYTAMFARTGEDPTRCSIGFDGTGNNTIGEPVGDPLRVGQIINEEIDATVQGYRAQVNHAVFVGGASTPGYDYYRAGFEIAATLIKEASIVPGKTTIGDFVKRYMARLDELGAEDTSGVMFHSSGIGNLSRPRVGPSSATEEFEIVLQPGMTFDYKPAFRLKRSKMADVVARNREIQVGEHFLVTGAGLVRLGTRDIVPIAVQA
jgi:Xaa-Pro aminopeptidase